jgi:hypothetical protein
MQSILMKLSLQLKPRSAESAVVILVIITRTIRDELEESISQDTDKGMSAMVFANV